MLKTYVVYHQDSCTTNPDDGLLGVVQANCLSKAFSLAAAIWAEGSLPMAKAGLLLLRTTCTTQN